MVGLVGLEPTTKGLKVRGHSQRDVLIGFAVGTLAGYYAHSREQPIILNILPGGFMTGRHSENEVACIRDWI